MKVTGHLLMLVGGFCLVTGLLSFFVSLFTLVANGLTLVILGGLVFGAGVAIDLLAQLQSQLLRLADSLDDIASVARFLSRKEGASRERSLREVSVVDDVLDAPKRTRVRQH